MKGKAKEQSLLIRFLKSPAKIIKKVTNLYVQSMLSCANGMGGNAVVNCGIATPQVLHLPRNFSVSSSSSRASRQEEDLKELIRAVSTRRLVESSKVEMKDVEQFPKPRMMGGGSGHMNALERRSYSVGIGKVGRIDEEEACDFKEVDANGVPRCKSYAVPGRTV